MFIKEYLLIYKNYSGYSYHIDKIIKKLISNLEILPLELLQSSGVPNTRNNHGTDAEIEEIGTIIQFGEYTNNYIFKL